MNSLKDFPLLLLVTTILKICHSYPLSSGENEVIEVKENFIITSNGSEVEPNNTVEVVDVEIRKVPRQNTQTGGGGDAIGSFVSGVAEALVGVGSSVFSEDFQLGTLIAESSQIIPGDTGETVGDVLGQVSEPLNSVFTNPLQSLNQYFQDRRTTRAPVRRRTTTPKATEAPGPEVSYIYLVGNGNGGTAAIQQGGNAKDPTQNAILQSVLSSQGLIGPGAGSGGSINSNSQTFTIQQSGPNKGQLVPQQQIIQNSQQFPNQQGINQNFGNAQQEGSNTPGFSNRPSFHNQQGSNNRPAFSNQQGANPGGIINGQGFQNNNLNGQRFPNNQGNANGQIYPNNNLGNANGQGFPNNPGNSNGQGFSNNQGNSNSQRFPSNNQGNSNGQRFPNNNQVNQNGQGFTNNPGNGQGFSNNQGNGQRYPNNPGSSNGQRLPNTQGSVNRPAFSNNQANQNNVNNNIISQPQFSNNNQNFNGPLGNQENSHSFVAEQEGPPRERPVFPGRPVSNNNIDKIFTQGQATRPLKQPFEDDEADSSNQNQPKPVTHTKFKYKVSSNPSPPLISNTPFDPNSVDNSPDDPNTIPENVNGQQIGGIDNGPSNFNNNPDNSNSPTLETGHLEPPLSQGVQNRPTNSGGISQPSSNPIFPNTPTFVKQPDVPNISVQVLQQAVTESSPTEQPPPPATSESEDEDDDDEEETEAPSVISRNNEFSTQKS